MTWMTIVGIGYAIMTALHLIKRPWFTDISESGISLWFFQFWFYNFIAMFMFVADTFYSKIR